MSAAASQGGVVASLLSGSWRQAPAPWEGTAEQLQAAAPFLLRSGAAGLGHRRLAASPLGATPAALALRQAFRMQVLHAAARAPAVPRAFARLRRAGVDAVLGKGWAAARLYPEAALRPYGDADLYVPHEQAASAAAALAGEDPGIAVDLHAGFADLDDRDPDALLARSRTIVSHGVPVRVFGPEDHLRLLGLHMMRHGAWRPLWLCDVAAAIEAGPLDWDRVLEGDARRSGWVAAAASLACGLLGAARDALPPRARAVPPRWVRSTVLEQWGRAGFEPQGARAPLASVLGKPRALVRGLATRWPNAIEASVGISAGVTAWPRLPYQIAECVRRTALFALGRPAG